MNRRVIYTPHWDAILIVEDLPPNKKWKKRLKVVDGPFKGTRLSSDASDDEIIFFPDSIDLGEL